MCHVKHTPSTPAALVALALTATLTLAGCGADEKGGDGSPGPDPASSPSEESPTEAEPSESAEPSEPAEPETPLGTGAAPATGQELTFDALSLRLPQGWKVVSKDVEGFTARPKGLTLDYLTLQFLANDGLTSPPEQARREHDESDGFAKDPPLILPPVEVDGVAMFHRSGQRQSHHLARVLRIELDGVHA